MGVRRRSRECALMILYQIDVSGQETERAVGRFFDAFWNGEPMDPAPPWLEDLRDRVPPLPTGAREYAEQLVRGVRGHIDPIDARIQQVSSHWRVDRMAKVDRNILRIGTYELCYLQSEVPRKVAINEAVDIAKTFSTAESSAFINGILDRVEA